MPNRGNKSNPLELTSEDAFYRAVFEHALAFFGSRVLYPARPAFRDADLAELYELTREDLELQTGLPFADAVEAIDLLTRLRESDSRNDRRACNSAVKEHIALPDCLAQALALVGRKYEYVTEQLGYLAGNDLYDAYVAGLFTPNALRKLFLAHVDEPGIAREAYFQLNTRLK